jgi:hypothetical protein
MAIKWYSPLPKATAEVKLTNDNVTLTEAGLARLRQIDSRFENAQYVRLGWDPDTHSVAITAADELAADSFKFGRRGRTQTSRTVNAGRLFASFGITASEATLTDGKLRTQDGMAVFGLNIGGAAPIKRRRGRRPKSEIAA